MNTFMETILSTCFPQTTTLLPDIIVMELENSMKTGTKSLALLCILAMIRKKIRMESTAGIYYKLLIREKMDIFETSQLIRDDDILEDDLIIVQLIKGFNRFVSRQRKLHSFVRNEPYAMEKVLEQNLNCKKHLAMYVYILEKKCCVEVDRKLVVEVAHEDFGTHWPLVFARIGFAKSIPFIQLELEVCHRFDKKPKDKIFEKFVDDIGLVSPGDPHWPKAIKASQSIYFACPARTKNRNLLNQVFILEDSGLIEQLPDHRRIYL